VKKIQQFQTQDIDKRTSVVAQLRPLTQLSKINKDNAEMLEIEPYAGEFVRAASPLGDGAAYSPLNIGGSGGISPQIGFSPYHQPPTQNHLSKSSPKEVDSQ
jgi:hypothetical protein